MAIKPLILPKAAAMADVMTRWLRWRDWLNIRHKRFWCVVALVLYTVAGFLLLPWLVERQLVNQLSALLERPVHIAQVRINPYVLSAELSEFKVTEQDGAPLLGFERLFINFQLSSLWRWAWTFDEITLEKPVVEVTRFASGDSNLQQLVLSGAPSQAASDSTAVPIAEHRTDKVGSRSLPRLRIHSLSVLDGELGFRDETREGGFVTRLAPIDFHATGIGTLAGQSAEQQLTLRGENDTELTVSGDLQLNPLQLQGQVVASGSFLPVVYRYFSAAIDARLATGELMLALDYQLNGGDQGFGIQLDNGALTLSNLALLATDSEASLLTLQALELRDLHFAWPEKVATASALQLTAPSLALSRRADGSINLQHLLVAADEAQTSVAASSPPLADWQLSLDTLALASMTVQFEDHTLAPAAAVTVEPINVSLQQLSNQPGARFPVTVSALLADQGSLAVEGELGLLPQPQLRAALTVQNLPLALAQPYLDTVANIAIEDGRLALKAVLTHAESDPFSARGEVVVSDLKTRGKRQKRPLLGWQQAIIDNIEYRASDNSLALSALRFDTPYLRLRLNEDQTTNFQRLLISSAAEPAAVTASPQESSMAPPLALTMGQISVVDGTVDFTDRTLPILFQTTVTGLKGKTSALDLNSREPVTLNLQGQVADYGLAQVSGSLLPLEPGHNTRLEVLFRNVEVPDLSPYTVKFASHEIASGRMDLDLRYQVDHYQLKGDNNIVLSDLTLGDKVPYEGALDLPLGLAIALLKNADGKIDIDLPVSGDMGSPEFRLGGVIASAVGTLLRRAITAPFRLLGKLVGVDSEDFGKLVFQPGSAELTPPESEKLDQLASAIAQRPQLNLQVPAAFSDADRAALAEIRVDEMMAEQLLQVEKAGDSDKVAGRKRRELSERLFVERYPGRSLDTLAGQHQVAVDAAAPEGAQRLDTTAYLAALRRQVVAAEVVAEAALQQLGEARATAIVEALSAAGVDRARLQRESGQPVKANDKGWVPLALGVGRR